MKRLAIVFAIALFSPLAAFAQNPLVSNLTSASSPLGGISPRRAFSESSVGQAEIARLQSFRAEKTRALEARNKELAAREQSLKQTAPMLSDEARAVQSKEIEKFRLDIERFIQDAQAEFLGVQRDVETSFLVKLEPAISRVAKAKGLQLVFNLDLEFVVWFEPLTDITPDVIKELAQQ